MFLRNVGICLQLHTISQPKRLQSHLHRRENLKSHVNNLLCIKSVHLSSILTSITQKAYVTISLFTCLLLIFSGLYEKRGTGQRMWCSTKVSTWPTSRDTVMTGWRWSPRNYHWKEKYTLRIGLQVWKATPTFQLLSFLQEAITKNKAGGWRIIVTRSYILKDHKVMTLRYERSQTAVRSRPFVSWNDSKLPIWNDYTTMFDLFHNLPEREDVILMEEAIFIVFQAPRWKGHF
jgi:hypothetical protein